MRDKILSSRDEGLFTPASPRGSIETPGLLCVQSKRT